MALALKIGFDVIIRDAFHSERSVTVKIIVETTVMKVLVKVNNVNVDVFLPDVLVLSMLYHMRI